MNIKKACHIGHAFFYACHLLRLPIPWLLLTGVMASPFTTALNSVPTLKQCQLSKQQLYQLDAVKVQSLKDGDSLILSDGREVRLIGINTPEMYKKPNGFREPLAEEAKQTLKRLLDEGFYIAMGQQTHDRFGRILAYAYDKTGYSVEAQLLQLGLGFLVAYPPNLAHLSCHQASQALAKQDKRGVWGHHYYQTYSSTELTTNNTGFARINGTLTRIDYGQSSWWLQLDGKVVLKIAKRDQSYFSKAQLNALKSSNVTLNGWMIDRSASLKNKKHSPFVLLLKHPTQFE